IALAVFNMIPIPPLDGSHILSSVLSIIAPPLMETYENLRQYGSMLLIVFVVINNNFPILGYLCLPALILVDMFLRL
ncbi:MAG: Zn-dependent protease, partial [bacterium]